MFSLCTTIVVPTDKEIDPHKVATMLLKIKLCVEKIETSEFFSTLVDQIQTRDFIGWINRVMGHEQKMKMVIYGIGSIDSGKSSCLQLCLAILMKKHYSWIGEVEVFDPILSATETRVLEILDFSVLSVDEQGRRQALKPTLFYMPHCPSELYENLLQANWKVDKLKNVVLLGNSFKVYQGYNSPYIASKKNLLAAIKFARELRIDNTTDGDYYRGPFRGTSWQFFNPVSEIELQL